MKVLAVLAIWVLVLGAALPAAGQAPGNLRLDEPLVLGASVEPATEKKAEAAAPGEELVSIIVTFDDTLNGRDLERASGGQATYRYREILNGASLVLAREALPSLAGLAGVTGIYHDRAVTLETQAGPVHAGTPGEPSAFLGGPENGGEGTVVGVIDSGIWPEHPAFSDPDPTGLPYPAPPMMPGDEGFGGRVKRSTCDFGAEDWNPDDSAFSCNNKLIGAYRFMDTHDALHGLPADDYASARDSHGSGSHSASVAAGALTGVAPRAHLIAYRVSSGPEGMAYYSDIAAAIEQAILDGVNVLAYSFGGGADPYGEVPSLALLEAYDRGMFVAVPAGNDGPDSNTVAHREPWVMVAAANHIPPDAAPATAAAMSIDPRSAVLLGGPLGLMYRVPPPAALPRTDAPRIAEFSGRGGPEQRLGISKPDISAEGVGLEGAGLTLALEDGGSLARSGTAVSAAQLAGAGAVLKYLHPGWTPGQIQSALMTSARSEGQILAGGASPAEPFDTGSGGLDLDRASRVSVTMRATASQFVQDEEELWRANVPSLYLPAMPGRVLVERRVENTYHEDRKWLLSARGPEDVSIGLPNQLRIQANGAESFEISIDAREVPLGEVRHATIEFQEGKDLVLHMPVTLVRQQPPVSLATTCSQALMPPQVTTSCLITMTNTSEQDAVILLTDPLPERLAVIPESVVGGSLEGDLLYFQGDLAGAVPPLRLAGEPPLYGYVPLAGFGLEPAPCPDDCDDGGFVVSGLDFVYQDLHYDEAIWSVNGTLELGTSSGTAASGANSPLPDPALPNNLLAPWWTDLDLSAGGEWYLGALTDGEQIYDVFEWREVPRYKDEGARATFQIWLARGTNLGWFTYGDLSGDVADGTTGLEDAMGTGGDTHYHGETETGVVPSGHLHLDQNSGAPGETHTLTFTAQGAKKGRWQNCARMTGDLWGGEAIACFMGQVME